MKNSANLCIALLILAVLGCSCPSKLANLGKKDESAPPPGPTTSSTPVTKGATPPPLAKGDYDLSMAKYKQLSVGMARSKVEAILGGEGTEVSSSTGGGMRFSVNKWEGERFTSIIISFKNDKVISKSQVGLK